MKPAPKWLRLVLVLSILAQAAGPGFAQSLPFPPAPETAALAAAQFDFRASAVVERNACSREDEYLRIRTEMAAENFDSQGEDLSHILVAKIAYIRAQAQKRTHIPCSGQLFRPQPLDAEGKPVQTYEEFEAADRILRAAGPTACAEETARIEQVKPAGTVVHLRVSVECMGRQVNEAVMAMRKTTQLGSSKLPCLETLSGSSEGEFDVNVRELMRILYLSGPRGQREGGILAPSTIDHMYDQLLAARGALSEGSYPIVTGCSEPAGDELGSPEDTADRHAWYRELGKFLGDLFKWLARKYVEYSLLSGVGGLVVMPFLLLSDAEAAPFDLRVPESENHRLMIETSRYLTNADIIARLEAEGYDHVEDVRHDQGEVHEWLLRRLQDIASRDFQEYNSRPYTRYSLNAILNLHDFAAVKGDPVLADAARIVLDLAEAKFAATSNRGRRIVPFRRVSDADGDENSYLYESISGSDHHVTRALLLTGQTQILDQGQDRRVVLGTLAELVNAATSTYRLPPPVLAAAIERRTFTQTVMHTGVERVLQSPAFTISAGGIPTGPTGTINGFGQASDRGIAMPTVIIPTLGGAYVRDLFRFEGVGRHSDRTANTCVAPGFACGIEPKFSAAFTPCTAGELMTGQDLLFFTNSAACFPGPGPHFYLAARTSLCAESFCPNGRLWGVMDIIDVPPPGERPPGVPDPFETFKTARRAALTALTLDGDGNGTYVTAAGLTVHFTVDEEQPAIRGVGGTVPPGWPPAWLTAGGVFDADGKGKATIHGPGGPVVIDFTNWFDPRRTP